MGITVSVVQFLAQYVMPGAKNLLKTDLLGKNSLDSQGSMLYEGGERPY